MVLNLRTIGFQELVSFHQVVKQGGITAAANELGIAKSAVSNHITRLEEKLNVKLLNRHSRRVNLTKEGERLLPRVESLLAEGEQLFQEAETEEKAPRGVVRIASTPEFAQQVLVDFLPLVKQHFPEIQVVLKTAYDFEDMQDPSFDLAFRINQLKDERLVAVKIGHFHRHFFAHPDLTNLSELSCPTQLKHYPCLVFSESSVNRSWSTIHLLTGETIELSIDGSTSVQSFSMLAQLASRKQGVCYVPNFVANPHLQAGTLRRILPEWRSRESAVFLAYRPNSKHIARVNAVLSLAKERVPELIEQIKLKCDG